MDARTRQLATQSRLLPHKSVGIISKQIPESADESLHATTEGTIALSLPAATLSAVVELLQKDQGSILKGPNEAKLDLVGPVSRDEIDVWLNAVAKRTVVQDGFQRDTVGVADQAALPSVEEPRAQARHHIESGAIIEEYMADRQQVLTVLNQVLATELVCALRYKSHYYRASGMTAQSVKN